MAVVHKTTLHYMAEGLYGKPTLCKPSIAQCWGLEDLGDTQA